MQEFTTKVEVDIISKNKLLGLEELDCINEVSDLYIKWSLDFEQREWGIKSLDFYVPDQEITIFYNASTKDHEDGIDMEKTFIIKNVKIDASYANFNVVICPHRLIIDEHGDAELVF